MCIKKKKSKVILFFIVVFALIGLFCINDLCILVFKADNACNVIGIIDDDVSEIVARGMEYTGNYNNCESHGEKLIKYLKCKGYNGKIYYYSAQTNDGIIDSDSVIQGLEYLKELGVNRINLSFSSKYYSKELDDWLKKNSQIRVFCSYNNLENSYDYPAMYKLTIASGMSDRVNYKSCDKKYKNNRIIVIDKGIYFFKGNSFLSIETLLSMEEDDL